MNKVLEKESADSSHNLDKAGKDYWTRVWLNTPLPEPFPYKSNKINDFPSKVLHQIFKEIFKNYAATNKKLLEIGCGNSVLLSYLGIEYGFELYGIDYSPYGCQQSRRILERDKLPGTIIETDAFNPPLELLNSFDVVCSFGVAEHFKDTSATLKAFSNFLKPGGLLITSVPNLAGITGKLQKWLNRPVFDIHVVMDKKELENANTKAGLVLNYSNYFNSVSFSVTLQGLEGEKISGYFMKKFFIKSIRYLSKVIWLFEKIFGQLPAGKSLSGGIITVAKKPYLAV